MKSGNLEKKQCSCRYQGAVDRKLLSCCHSSKGCSNILLIIFISLLIGVAYELLEVSYLSLTINDSEGS